MFHSESCNMCHFVCDLFHLACFKGSFMLQHVLELHSFIWLNISLSSALQYLSNFHLNNSTYSISSRYFFLLFSFLNIKGFQDSQSLQGTWGGVDSRGCSGHITIRCLDIVSVYSYRHYRPIQQFLSYSQLRQSSHCPSGTDIQKKSCSFLSSHRWAVSLGKEPREGPAYKCCLGFYTILILIIGHLLSLQSSH